MTSPAFTRRCDGSAQSIERTVAPASRQAGVLRAQSAWKEDGDAGRVAERLVPLLGETAAWQGLGDVVVAEGARGDLAPILAAELAAQSASGG